MKCKNCGAEMQKEENVLKIPELKIEVTKPEIWTKSYKDIKKPKGFRLPHIWELFQIHEMPKYKDFIFGEEGYLVFWCEQLSTDKRNKWSRCLYRDRDLDLGAWDDDLSCSVSGGRVVFVRGEESEND